MQQRPKSPNKSLAQLATTFVPLSQLGKVVTETPTAVVLRRAQALYEADPTDAHYENLREAKAEHKLAFAKGQQEKGRG